MADEHCALECEPKRILTNLVGKVDEIHDNMVEEKVRREERAQSELKFQGKVIFYLKVIGFLVTGVGILWTIFGHIKQ